MYEFRSEKSESYMKKAWGGQVWDKGFKMVITYNTGREEREAAAIMLKENIISLNPKFQIEVRNVDWKDYMPAIPPIPDPDLYYRLGCGLSGPP